MLWDRDECVKFGGQKVTVQGDGGITYVGTITASQHRRKHTILKVSCQVSSYAVFADIIPVSSVIVGYALFLIVICLLQYKFAYVLLYRGPQA